MKNSRLTLEIDVLSSRVWMQTSDQLLDFEEHVVSMPQGDSGHYLLNPTEQPAIMILNRTHWFYEGKHVSLLEIHEKGPSLDMIWWYSINLKWDQNQYNFETFLVNKEFREVGIRYDFKSSNITKFYQDDSMRLVERPGKKQGS